LAIPAFIASLVITGVAVGMTIMRKKKT
jgi:hypothetical protein